MRSIRFDQETCVESIVCSLVRNNEFEGLRQLFIEVPELKEVHQMQGISPPLQIACKFGSFECLDILFENGGQDTVTVVTTNDDFVCCGFFFRPATKTVPTLERRNAVVDCRRSGLHENC